MHHGAVCPPKIVDPPPTRHYAFADVMAWPGDTAASRGVPLMIGHDRVDGPGPHSANLHGDFCSLYIVRRGRGFHVIDGVSYGVSRGDVYAMGPGMRHHFEGGENLLTDTLHFSPTIFDREARDALAETPGFHSLFVAEPLERGSRRHRPEAEQQRWLHLTPTQYAALQTVFAELHAEWSSSTAVGALLTRGLFFRLLVVLSRFYAENSQSVPGAQTPAPMSYAGAHEATVAAAVRYLEARFREPLRIEQVAASVFLSPDRFTEVFALAMGRTPRDYLRHLRVEHAKMLLATTDLPMAEVAEAAGFTEPAYFTRVLRAATGVPPSEYRRLATRK